MSYPTVGGSQQEIEGRSAARQCRAHIQHYVITCQNHTFRAAYKSSESRDYFHSHPVDG